MFGSLKYVPGLKQGCCLAYEVQISVINSVRLKTHVKSCRKYQKLFRKFKKLSMRQYTFSFSRMNFRKWLSTFIIKVSCLYYCYILVVLRFRVDFLLHHSSITKKEDCALELQFCTFYKCHQTENWIYPKLVNKIKSHMSPYSR